uniref:glycoside hydrolase domain-containing protein n=1 Tax=Pedobacter schmidteae TaxID=2201271 RepID=UPI000EB2F52C|nr:glycoside hydrolase domain-containing protein [Pedobacter schmidteae]
MKQTIALLLILFLAKNIQAQDTPPVTYPPLTIKGYSIYLSGKQLDLNLDGFPAMVQTSFKLITEPIHFHLPRTSNHKDIKLKIEPILFSRKVPKKINWTVKNTSDSLNMEVKGNVDLSGKMDYAVKITALQDIDLDNIRLHIPFTPEAAKYVRGLHQTSDERAPAIDWKWATTGKDQSKVWVGNTNGGLQYILQDNKHNALPVSWSNGDKGGIHIEQKGKAILADNYSGEHHMKKGEVLYYNFSMQITTEMTN